MNPSKPPLKPNVLKARKKIPGKPQAATSMRHYQTQSKDEKRALILKIWKAVDPSFQNPRWFHVVTKFKPPEYQNLLRQLYPGIDYKKIPATWKKMKRMLNSLGRADYRGNALFGNKKEKKELNGHIVWVIQNRMKTRCFEELRIHVLPKIREMFERNRREFSDQMFKKHFWSYFLNDPENQNVKALWKNLPRTKPRITRENAGRLTPESSAVEIETETEAQSPMSQQEEEETINYDYQGSLHEEDPDRFIQNYSETESQDFQLREQAYYMPRFLPPENLFERDFFTQDGFILKRSMDSEEKNLHFHEDYFGKFNKKFHL